MTPKRPWRASRWARNLYLGIAVSGVAADIILSPGHPGAMWALVWTMMILAVIEDKHARTMDALMVLAQGLDERFGR